MKRLTLIIGLILAMLSEVSVGQSTTIDKIPSYRNLGEAHKAGIRPQESAASSAGILVEKGESFTMSGLTLKEISLRIALFALLGAGVGGLLYVANKAQRNKERDRSVAENLNES